MSVPRLTSVTPTTGPASGGDVVTIVGTGFAPRVLVTLGGGAAAVLSVRDEGGVSIVHARTPPHAEGAGDVTVTNLDAAGAPIAGETATLPNAYRFQRARIVREADLTRIVRALLRELKRQVLENVSLSVATDFDDTPLDGLDVTAIATLPSLVLTGPRLRENRFYSTNEAVEEVVAGPTGPEIQRRRPPLTVDVAFALTGASDRAVELINLMAATATFLNRNRWLVLDRDPLDASAGTVRWEMDADGELRTDLDGKGDVRAFGWGLVIRGVDVDEGLPLDLAHAVADGGAEVGVGVMGAAS
jgi:hypothetical protein